MVAELVKSKDRFHGDGLDTIKPTLWKVDEVAMKAAGSWAFPPIEEQGRVSFIAVVNVEMHVIG